MTEKELNTPTSVNQLINVSDTIINGETVNSVDARELHSFLKSKQDFSTWVKAKVTNNPFFEENQDFILLHNIMEQNGSGGHNKKDYALTQDTAKKVSMAEQTDRGNEARDYFLLMEKKAKGLEKTPRLNQNEIQCNMIALKYTVEILKPSPASLIEMTKILYTDLGLKTNLLPNYAENVKIVLSATELLKRNECELKVRAFNSLLIDQGYLEEKTRPSSGGKIKSFKALTEKGLAYGQNDASPQNKLEIQPHYFEDSFMDLYRIITGE